MSLATLLCLGAGAALQGEPSPRAFVVDPNVRYQKWEGWGTSLCWWAHVVGGYPSAVREDLMGKIFGDLKLNVVRYNIGGGENPEHPDFMQPRARVPGYLHADGTWDWSADANQRWVLQRAKAMGADRFEAFSNSPPYFMTISGSVTGNKEGTDNIAPEQYDAFAEYLAEVNEHFRKAWGVTFETLEPLNEPAADWWKYGGKQEGCPVSIGAHQSGMIEALGRAMAKRNSRTHIAATDESVIDTAVKSWDGLSPEAKALTWRFNTHHYGGNAQKALHERISAAGKRLWMSEEGDNDPSGLTMAERIVKDLREMKPSAWVYWQVIDQKGSNWGLMDMDLNGQGQTYVVHPKFYVMQNFSRFVQPGSQIVEVGDENSIAAMKGSKLVIVTVNHGSPRTVRYDLSRFRRSGPVASVYRTSSNERLAKVEPVRVNARTLTTDLAADSVTTLVIDGCQS